MHQHHAYHLAQINIARALYSLEDPAMAEFVGQLDAINALADQSPGFVWRLQDDSGNATAIQAFEDPRIIVNMSVWESVEALFDFVYRSGHTGVMRRRRQWFEPPATAHMALWWVPAGERPSAAEGRRRLEHLRSNGPSAVAFTFKQRFPPPSDGQAAAGAPPQVRAI